MSRLKLAVFICTSSLLASCVSSCVSQPRIATRMPTERKQPVHYPQTPTVVNPAPHVERQPPEDYLQWVKQGDHQTQINQYYKFLKENHVERAAPIFELVRSARDWEKCGSEPFVVPPQELWDNLLPTLQVLQQLRDEKILEDIEVTSVYRDPILNQCANGAPRSKHVQNAALDFRIGSETPDTSELEKIADAKYKLCQFWAERGEQFNLGLGVYASGQIHLDTQGYRTWGPDLTHNSSICPT